MELTPEGFARLLRHMEEDEPNELARESLARGRELLYKLGYPVYNRSNLENKEPT